MSTKQKKSNPAPTTPSDQLLDVEGAAQYLGLTSKSVRKRVQERTIPYYKVGALLRFKKTDLNAWLAEHSFAPQEQ